jgi:hypothetical protein
MYESNISAILLFLYSTKTMDDGGDMVVAADRAALVQQ